MDHITMTAAGDFLIWAASIAGALLILIGSMKKILNKLFAEQMKPFEAKIEAVSKDMEEITKRLDKVDMNSTKNFLVRCLSDMERGEQMSEIEKERFGEQYDFYTAHAGNSYIKTRVERLKAEGKL